ncbi:lipase family protein [Dietzia sp. PP-33]|uniref:lipase family protein n=1 Tax=Dietzia sp. PP-33 TaxID=2957500 RepID=UPI0029BD89E5|nr:lipase family protein [Dietzia sp. PP-33]MDX2357734.1 lipase family protein [Dietzia sp. PP-33]
MRRLRAFATATATAALVVVGLAISPVAHADPLGSADTRAYMSDMVADPFYEPPADLPAQPGAVVRTQPVTIPATLPGADGAWPAAATRMMFTSRDVHDAPAAVTAMVIEESGPWRGPGERPTVVIAPGTTGQGNHCAISLAAPSGLWAGVYPDAFLSANQEIVSAAKWHAMGARVVVTDYIGLGTPRIHSYVDRVETGRAVLDAARAARALAGVNSPLLLSGYSQGGGATASAAELQPDYAPELDLRGTWAGAPVADLQQVLRKIDGTLIGGVIGWSVNGMVDRYPELRTLVDVAVSDRGRATLASLESKCIADVILKSPFLRTSDLTTDGRSLDQWIAGDPLAQAVLDDQKLGRLTPTSPVLITSSPNDDTVPYGQARALAGDWCAAGGDVTFRSTPLPAMAPGWTLPDHFGPLIHDTMIDDEVTPWLISTLEGGSRSGCSIA